MGSHAITLKRKRLLGGTVFLAVALTATGCGSREEGSTTAQEAPGTVAAAAPGAADAAGGAPDAAAGAGTTADTTATAADAAVGTTGTTVTTGATTSGSGSGTAAGTGTAAGSKASGVTKGPGSKVAGPAKIPGSKVAAPAKGTGPKVAGPAKVPGITPTGPGIDIKGPDSQGVAPTSIKLGVIAPVSGAAGFLGESEVAAIRAYTSLVNAQGGVKGRMYSTVIVDSQFEPALEAQSARKLVDQEKVFALFSVLGDSTGPFVTSKGIPTMVFGLNPPAFASKYPTTYVTGFSSMDSVTRMAYWMKVLQKKPIKDVAILYDTSNIPIAPWVKYLSAAWKATGATVKSTDAFNVSDGDCTSIVLKVQSLKIDFWQSGQSLNWPACAAAMGRQGWQPPMGFGGPYTSDNKFITQGGPIGMNGAYGEQVGIQVVQSFGQPYPYDGGKNNVAPLAKAYVDSIKKYAPNSADTDTLESIWTQTFWVAVQALTKAIETQTSAITWKGVNQWFAAQKHYKSGLVAPINFDPKCKSGSPVWIYQWKFNKTKNVFEQTPWKDYGGPFTVPDSFLNKIVPGAGQCYLSKAADNEL
jgi:ABC-type branched-subunit amino acid transport system substrate-binding protein